MFGAEWGLFTVGNVGSDDVEDLCRPANNPLLVLFGRVVLRAHKGIRQLAMFFRCLLAKTRGCLLVWAVATVLQGLMVHHRRFKQGKVAKLRASNEFARSVRIQTRHYHLSEGLDLSASEVRVLKRPCCLEVVRTVEE